MTVVGFSAVTKDGRKEILAWIDAAVAGAKARGPGESAPGR
jgi:hypothetical protein